MGIIARIKLYNKINKAIKQAKEVIDNNQGVASDVRKVLKNIQVDIEMLTRLLPSLKGVYKELKEIFNVK